MEATNKQARALEILTQLQQHTVKGKSSLITGLEFMLTEYFKHNIPNDSEDKSYQVLDAYQVFCQIVAQANELFNIKNVA